eukprot:357425-Chlamydomonas_euryale.AAC.11
MECSELKLRMFRLNSQLTFRTNFLWTLSLRAGVSCRPAFQQPTSMCTGQAWVNSSFVTRVDRSVQLSEK